MRGDPSHRRSDNGLRCPRNVPDKGVPGSTVLTNKDPIALPRERVVEVQDRICDGRDSRLRIEEINLKLGEG